MRILLACPSRGRSDALRRMVHSARRTATRPEQLFIQVRVDHDDPDIEGYRIERGWNLIQGKRERLPILWNELVAGHGYDLVMMAADDLDFRTTGWDDEVRAVFDQWPDRIGMVWADDGLHGEKFATHPFVSREWVEAVGFYLPESLHGDYVDNWINTLAYNVGRTVYLPRVYIEHLHPYAKKAEMDDTYAYRLSAKGRAKAEEAWKTLLTTDAIPNAIERLKGVMS